MPAPAIPTLTITDNQDGTATFAITGGNVGASNVVRTASLANGIWSNLVTISGNASSTVSLDPGFRWYSVLCNVGTDFNCSPPKGAITSISPKAVLDRCLDAVVTVVQAAADLGKLPGVATANVVRQDVVDPDHLPTAIPAIVITPGSLETETESTTESNDITYPIYIGIVDRKDQFDTTNTPDYLLMREVLRQLFISKPMPGILESRTNEISFELILDHLRDRESQNLFSSGIQVKAICRELRWS